MAEHVNVQHADTHEPRHITISTTADAGKVITPSNSTNGVSVLRFLNISDIDSTGIAAGNYLTSDGAGRIIGTLPANTQAATSLSGAPISVPTGTFVKIPFSSIDFQTGSWQLVSNSLIVPESGTYRVDFNATIKFTGNTKRTFFLGAGADSTGTTSVVELDARTEDPSDPSVEVYGNVSATSFLALSSDDESSDGVSLYISSDDTTGTVEIHRAFLSLSKVQ